MKPALVKLKAYNGSQVKVLGETEMNLKLCESNRVFTINVVVREGSCRILGRDVLKDFKSVFELEKCNKNATSACQYEVPRHYQKMFDIAAELNRLESEGIIESVNAADVAWLTPIIAVRKANDKMRLCGSYDLALNPHIESDFYKIPDDIFHKISGCHFCSKIDMYQAFFNIPLNDADKKLTAINTPCGVYLFNVLPYDIKSSPGIFNDFVQNTLIKDLVNVHAFYDDVIIASSSREEHIKDLHTFLSRCLDYNVTLNKDKCAFFRREIEFLGNVISSGGIKPSESKVEAICKAKKPSNVTELRSFLGLVNFLSRFVPKLSIVLKPLYFLLRKDTVFTWDKLANDSFDKCEDDLIAKSTLLSPFSIKDRLVVYIDAAEVGIAAILGKTENNIFKPIFFASRYTTDAESRYSQFDLEALSLVYAFTKFHKFVYGTDFIVFTDCVALMGVFASDTKRKLDDKLSPRVTRYVVFMSRYSYQLHQLRKRSCSNVSVRVPVHVPVRTSLEPETQPVA